MIIIIVSIIKIFIQDVNLDVTHITINMYPVKIK